jgi:hypothetical protein
MEWGNVVDAYGVEAANKLYKMAFGTLVVVVKHMFANKEGDGEMMAMVEHLIEFLGNGLRIDGGSVQAIIDNSVTEEEFMSMLRDAVGEISAHDSFMD